MGTVTYNTMVDVDIDLCEFDDEELIEELELRKYIIYADEDHQSMKDRIFKLKTVYDTMSYNSFIKELNLFFLNELKD
jgi:hypothetical protein